MQLRRSILKMRPASYTILALLLGGCPQPEEVPQPVEMRPITLRFDQEPAGQQMDTIRRVLSKQIQEAEVTEQQLPQPGPIRFRVGVADINNDGQNEIFVQIWSRQWCAPVGCNTWILQQSGASHRQILGDIHNGEQMDAVYVSVRLTSGYRDLYGADGTAVGTTCMQIRWTGTKYEPVPPFGQQCPQDMLLTPRQPRR